MKKNIICRFLLLNLIIVLCCNFTYATSVVELEKMLGLNDSVATVSIPRSGYSYITEKEMGKTLGNDLIKEMRPFLNDIIDDNIPEDHDFSASEIIKIACGHPINFFTALYNYVIYTINSVFDIASKGTGIDVDASALK